MSTPSNDMSGDRTLRQDQSLYPSRRITKNTCGLVFLQAFVVRGRLAKGRELFMIVYVLVRSGGEEGICFPDSSHRYRTSERLTHRRRNGLRERYD